MSSDEHRAANRASHAMRQGRREAGRQGKGLRRAAEKATRLAVRLRALAQFALAREQDALQVRISAAAAELEAAASAGVAGVVLARAPAPARDARAPMGAHAPAPTGAHDAQSEGLGSEIEDDDLALAELGDGAYPSNEPEKQEDPEPGAARCAGCGRELGPMGLCDVCDESDDP